MSASDIEHRFAHHPPVDYRVGVHHAMVRAMLMDVATSFDVNLVDGREKSMALTKLEEAMFWANASIARNQTMLDPDQLVLDPEA